MARLTLIAQWILGKAVAGIDVVLPFIDQNEWAGSVGAEAKGGMRCDTSINVPYGNIPVIEV